MSYQDSLCFVCGVAPDGGPEFFYNSRDLPEATQLIDAEFREAGLCSDVEELEQVILGPFLNLFYREELPKGMGRRQYSATWVGIGYWNEEGLPRFECDDHAAQSIPDGRDVNIRRVRGAEGYCGLFNRIVKDRAEEEDQDEDEEDAYDNYDDEDDERDEEEREAGAMEETVEADTVCNPDEGSSIFLCEHCYHYLEAWIDRDSLPPRSVAFPDDPKPMSFAGELYEIVTSQTRGIYP